jgi:hypothetical protein
MADGFAVSPGALESGSGQLGGLRDGVDQAGSDVAAALMGAAGSCGNAGVLAALNSFTKTVMQRFMDAMAGCEMTADRLARTAAYYRQAENENAQRAAAAARAGNVPGGQRTWGAP